MLLLSLLTGCSLVPAPCKAPEPTGHDPLIADGFLDVNSLKVLGGAGFLVHLLDLAVDEEAARLHGVGAGGYWVFDTDGAGFVDYQGGFYDQNTDIYDRVAVLADGVVAVQDRSTGDAAPNPTAERFNGVRFLDTTDPSDIIQLGSVSVPDIAFLAAQEGSLYVLRHSGVLAVYDVTDATAPVLLSELSGLGGPRALTLPDSRGLALVATTLDGLVRIDLSDETAPILLDALATFRGAVDVARTDQQAFLALGSAGVETFDLRIEPPVSLGVTPTGGTATQVTVRDGLVWVAAIDGIAVLRQQRDGPAAPHAFEPTDRFSLCVEPLPDSQGRAYGCAWSDLHVLQSDQTARAPQAVLSTTELRLSKGAESGSLTVTNRGAAALDVTLLDSWNGDFSAEPPQDSLAPGDTATLALEFLGGLGTDLTVCMASTDPGAGVQTIAVGTGDDVAALEVGAAAPDFSLPDVDGTWHTLSDYRGKPVLLVWFATW